MVVGRAPSRVAVSPWHVVALEDYGDVVCAVTVAKVYCARPSDVRVEVLFGQEVLVMESPTVERV
mgnify:CR=1 FL=1